MKRLIQIQWIFSAAYLLFNIKPIMAVFNSNLWSKEIDLVNHVTNYNIHLQVIGTILLITSVLLAWAIFKKISIPKWILIVIITLTVLLTLNTRIDLIRWMEINLLGGITLIVFSIILLLVLLWRMRKSPKTIKE